MRNHRRKRNAAEDQKAVGSSSDPRYSISKTFVFQTSENQTSESDILPKAS